LKIVCWMCCSTWSRRKEKVRLTLMSLQEKEIYDDNWLLCCKQTYHSSTPIFD
jgi:hypothetical protein